MAKLTKKGRKNLDLSKFALPEKRAYPVHDAQHAAFAELVAAKQLSKGNLTPAEKSRIDSKANKVLGKRSK